MRLLIVSRLYSRTTAGGSFALLVLAGAVAVHGCGSTPASPDGVHEPPPPPSLQVACVDQPSLRCTASVFGEGDVTAVSRWSVAESFRLAMDIPITAAGTVDFPTPGAPRTLSPDNVYIRADYASPRWGAMHRG
jgi:hypothetical protein